MGAQDVVERDLIKSARGADKIVSIAHEVIGNYGPRLELEWRLDRIALNRRWPEHQPSTMPVNALGLPVHLESCLAESLDRTTGLRPMIDLLAVTGSGARGKYQHGWSDLDVLVVADTSSPPSTARGRRTISSASVSRAVAGPRMSRPWWRFSWAPPPRSSRGSPSTSTAVGCCPETIYKQGDRPK